MHSLKFPAWFLTLFGLTFGGVSLWWIQDQLSFLDSAQSVEGVVVDLGRIDSFADLWLGPIIFGSVGTLLFAIGIGLFIWPARRRRMREILLRNGEKIAARITEVSPNHSIRINGRNPWRILAQALHDGKVHVFKSDNLWFDPQPYLDRREVDVYWMPMRPKEYWMDIRFLPEPAES